ncbi:uncharacterized protein BDR25DRAFT_356652 [Lindgomyces ingoldianus]|uniref:Uncharacterized protein n=1 Tax=Lindgomyces ingoldianus TaxID=673940 RepID=A0ACB6QSC3_9PLEO|nr:uncharacterized protein BDR25DRAFT_356652 [Lindgomyces ingoldianus]KAF2469420.1 hypothetical protein BDR25DRAFT_356652 [Lindgomyces ingoldianus]
MASPDPFGGHMTCASYISMNPDKRGLAAIRLSYNTLLILRNLALSAIRCERHNRSLGLEPTKICLILDFSLLFALSFNPSYSVVQAASMENAFFLSVVLQLSLHENALLYLFFGGSILNEAFNMFHLLLFVPAFFYCASAHHLVLQNITIKVPQGSSNHGDPHLLCRPRKAADVAAFFLGNYVAHAATLKNLPGQSIFQSFLDLIFALFFPVSGVIRGLNAIYGAVAFRETPLTSTLMAGAPCEVVRTDAWEPEPEDKIRNLRIIKPIANTGAQSEDLKHNLDEVSNDIESEQLRSRQLSGDEQQAPIILKVKDNDCILLHGTPHFDPADSWATKRGRQVHGNCQLPKVYALAIVPPSAKVREFSPCKMEVYCRIFVGYMLRATPSTETQQDEVKESLSRLKAFSKKLRNRFPYPMSPGPHTTGSSQLSSYHSVSKGVIAIFQLIFASYTFVRTKGDQLDRYGYAAYGLTVAPYLIMSFINLVSAIFSPDYSHVYLVSSEAMEEARRRADGHFEGVIWIIDVGQDTLLKPSGIPINLFVSTFGRSRDSTYIFEMDTSHFDVKSKFDLIRLFSILSRMADDGSQTWVLKLLSKGLDHYLAYKGHKHRTQILIPSTSKPKDPKDQLRDRLYDSYLTIASGLIGCLSFIVSSPAQLGFVLSWLVTGILIGPLVHFFPYFFILERPNIGILRKFALLLYAAPAIGGMVVVGKMIWEFSSTCGFIAAGHAFTSRKIYIPASFIPSIIHFFQPFIEINTLRLEKLHTAPLYPRHQGFVAPTRLARHSTYPN